MIYTNEVTRDIASQMATYREAGKSIDACAKATAKDLQRKYGKTYKWTSVRAKYYDSGAGFKLKKKMHKQKAAAVQQAVNATDVRHALANLARTSESMTIQVSGKMVTVVYK